jgi:hypothetical protein
MTKSEDNINRVRNSASKFFSQLLLRLITLPDALVADPFEYDTDHASND